jgi:hypothetical protein
MLAKLNTFLIIGGLTIAYIYLMNWSLIWFITFKNTYKDRQRDKKRSYLLSQYCWKEIVSIPVYLFTWGSAITSVVILLGWLVYSIGQFIMKWWVI